MTVFGISIGTKRTGICVLQNGILIDRNIHNFTGLWSEKKLHFILKCFKRYIVKRKVDAIIVKIPPLKRHTKPITELLQGIEVLAKQHNCEFDLTTKKEIKHITTLRNMNSLIEYARLLYPELLPVFLKGVNDDHSYFKKMYEAILSANIYQERQRVRALQIARTKE
jgi:RNase H-fold protein (predicted Holliday junction resolvase)